jgi:hypothetical protein
MPEKNMAAIFHNGRRMVVAVCLLMPPLALGQTLNDDQWKNVVHAQKGREFPYTVLTRDLGCAEGTIVAAAEQALTLKRKDGVKVTVSRGDVLRLRQLSLKPDAILYSARNSWSDVTEVPHSQFRSDIVLVVLRDGSKHHGELFETQDSSLTLAQGKKPRQTLVRIAKADISEVYCVTFKRMTAEAEFIYEELVIFWVFDPAIWPALVDRGTLVLLYRTGIRENNEPVACSHEL